MPEFLSQLRLLTPVSCKYTAWEATEVIAQVIEFMINYFQFSYSTLPLIPNKNNSWDSVSRASSELHFPWEAISIMKDYYTAFFSERSQKLELTLMIIPKYSTAYNHQEEIWVSGRSQEMENRSGSNKQIGLAHSSN